MFFLRQNPVESNIVFTYLGRKELWFFIQRFFSDGPCLRVGGRCREPRLYHSCFRMSAETRAAAAPEAPPRARGTSRHGDAAFHFNGASWSV